MKPSEKSCLSFAVRPIIYSIASALSFVGVEAHAQFASTPLYLQNSSSSGGQLAVKHNIMLFIDDSGSMRYVPGARREPNRSEKARLTITKDVLNKVLDKYKDQFNWGLQTLHNNGGTDAADFKTPWYAIKESVNGITASGGTPTTRRYYEIVSNIVMPGVEYRCQKSFVVLMSDGDANLSQKCGRFASSRTAAFNYPARLKYDDYFGSQTRAGACREATGGSYDTFWDRDTGLSFFSRKLSSEDFLITGTDKAGKSWQGDPSDPKTAGNPDGFKDQLIQTFTIGFGRDISQDGKTYLTKGASKDEYYFSAESENDLYRAFDTITDSINEESRNAVIETTGTTAPAVTNSGISGMAANVQLDTGSWSSRIQFYDVDRQTGAVNTASFKSPLFSERKALIHDGTNVHWAEQTNKYGSDAFFGLTKKEGEWKGALMPWLMRSVDDNTIAKTYSEAAGYGQNYRIRETTPEDRRNIGDIVDSPVLTIGGNTSDGLLNGRNEFMVTAANDGMVYLFQSRDNTNPYSLKLNYIPAGMERSINYGGKNVAETLKEVADEKYGSDSAHPHRYLVNGGIVVRRTAEDDTGGIKGQQSFLFGAMGQGGRGAYALNVGGANRATGEAVGLNADSSSWDTKVPLFETAKGENNTLNYTVGTPQIGRIALERNSDGTVKSGSRKIETDNGTQEQMRYQNTRYAGFLANGYSIAKGGQTESALYIYDMLGQDADSGEASGSRAGTLIKKLVADGAAQGLSAPTLVDADFDGIVDVAYAGDYTGNMYRFDLRGEDSSKWSVKKIYSGSAGQPITSAPAVSRYAAGKYVVIFGTGSDVYQDDITEKARQAVYGIYDDLSLSGDENPATAQDLVEQVLSETTDGSGNVLREVTSDTEIGDKKGWMVKLGDGDGERVVVKPTMILRTAVISTRIYNQKTETRNNAGQDPCLVESHQTETSGNSWILALNARTGGALGRNDAHIQFIKSDQPALYYAGLKQEGITSFTYMDGSKNHDSPVTNDGDSGGSGTDRSYKTPNSDIPNNTCFIRRTTRVLLTNKNQSYQIGGRICEPRRLSWREVFYTQDGR